MPIKAHVRDGRIVLDDPSALPPEGTALFVTVLEPGLPLAEAKAAVRREIERRKAEASD